MIILYGLGLQDPYYPYDHPYFGPIFLAAIFKMIGYPNSANPSAVIDVHSIEMLNLVPRILMGLLAVLDTFLIYEISKVHYNRDVALIASVLFAVMPITWITRWILLDSIQLPFLLSSILFALYSMKIDSKKYINRHKFLIILSGTFLGLAIFTKIPVFSMIPLIGFILLKENKNLRSLSLWLIPVLLIPLCWVEYSVAVGQFQLWLHGVVHQATRTDRPPMDPVKTLFRLDPVLMISGIAGLIFATIRKDYFLLLWTIPFSFFFAIVGYGQYFHIIPIIPAFCIAVAQLIVQVSYRTKWRQVRMTLLELGIISSLAIFGLVSIVTLLTTNVNASYFDISTVIYQHLLLPNSTTEQQHSNDLKETGVTVIGSHAWVWNSFWMSQYIFRENHYVADPLFDPNYKTPLKSGKVLLIFDDSMRKIMRQNPLLHFINPINGTKYNESMRQLYSQTHVISSFKNPPISDRDTYPWVKGLSQHTIAGRTEIRVNCNY